MASGNERIRKYLDAGNVLGQVTRGRAEEIVRELVNAGDIQRSQAQEWVDTLVEHSRKSSDQVLERVRREVAAQLHRLDRASLEHVANQVADLLKQSAEAGQRATRDMTTRAGKTAKAARAQAGRTAKAARTEAGKTVSRARTEASKQATRARTEAGKQATRARTEAGKTAKRARAAAERVTPRRPAKKRPATTGAGKKTKASKSAAKKGAAKKSTAAKKAAS
jgi:polyhydroxyalkanoate synthesis regulator phasin